MIDAIFTEDERRSWVEAQMLAAGIKPATPLCQCARCQRVSLLPMTPPRCPCGNATCPGAQDHRMCDHNPKHMKAERTIRG